MKYQLDPSLEWRYQQVIDFCSDQPAYYRHRFCGTKNGNVYLKIVTRKGKFFNESQLDFLKGMVERLSTNHSLNINKLNGTVTLLFYE